jgi:DNA (cytosine-5)-methyltransferase 1
MNPSTKPLRYLSVFSGMEAATVAWHQMGWTPVGFSEIEPFPSEILKHHYPTIPNYGDITQYKQWPIERGSIDLLVGGSPCQAFSVAGLRKGLDDPRGNLALTFLGLAEKLRPKYILWENVPGVLSSSGGEDFASFIGALAQFGYGFAWRVLDAQYFGVPQRRKRVFLLAIDGASNWKAAGEILFEPEGLRGDIAEGDKKGKATPSDAGASVETSGILWSGGDQANAERVIDKAGTLNCNKGQRGGYICPTVLDRAAFNQGQNAKYEPFIEQTEICPTLVARGPHAVQMPFRKSKRACSENDHETWVQADSSNTLNNFDLGDTRTTHAVVYENNRRDGLRTYEGTSPTLQGFMGTGGGNVPMVNESVEVRRLTPIETERLQGFSDNYSQIPWNGKPADQCPDGPRYKACGNSMAVPCMAWIGRRIQKHIDGTL